jgi:mRNA interferase RelE/StbE
MYEIEISRTAEKQLKKLNSNLQRKISAVILSLSIEPRPYGCKKLSGFEALYRVRCGDYRIIYEVLDKKVTVTILKLGHRKDIYK